MTRSRMPAEPKTPTKPDRQQPYTYTQFAF